VYGKLQSTLDSAIDDIGSVSQSDWIRQVALPSIRKLPLAEVESQACIYFRGLDRLEERERKKQVGFIESTACDSDTEEGDRYLLIVQHLLDNGGRRLVKSLVRRGKLQPGVTNESGAAHTEAASEVQTKGDGGHSKATRRSRRLI
jgi:hypothetical protein